MNKIIKLLQILRSLHKTLYFNFKYLPFKQACKLPILLYKPKFIKCKGKIIIDSKTICTGMIKLGFNHAHAYPHSGIVFENYGGTIVFKGRCVIGNNSSISVGPTANLQIGDNFNATTTFKLICWYNINFDYNVRFGWDNLVLDTSFHRLKTRNGDWANKGYGNIYIGHDNWIATRCIILAGTETQPYTVVATNSLLQKRYDKSYVLLGGSPAKIIKEGIYRDLFDDSIDYR